MRKLPKTEHQAMKYIWSKGTEKVASKDIAEYMLQKYNWSKGTSGKVLSRLVEKGFLKHEKEGRNVIYAILVNSEDYINFETKEFFDFVHNKSLSSIISSLGESDSISEDDINDLENWIKSR